MDIYSGGTSDLTDYLQVWLVLEWAEPLAE